MSTKKPSENFSNQTPPDDPLGKLPWNKSDKDRELDEIDTPEEHWEAYRALYTKAEEIEPRLPELLNGTIPLDGDLRKELRPFKPLIKKIIIHREAMGDYLALDKNAVVDREKEITNLKRLLYEINLDDILDPSEDIDLPALPEFNASIHFLIDTSETAKVRISYLGDNFKNNFLSKQEPAIPAITLRGYKLKQNALDKSTSDKPGILDELRSEYETTLSQLYYLLSQQPHGESGFLLNDGKANICYTSDVNGKVWAVSALWGGGGWGVDVYSVGDPLEWSAGRQVVSR